MHSWQPSVLWKKTSLFPQTLCCSCAVHSSCLVCVSCVCVCVCVGIKVVFQHSCVKFNLLSQKAFNPFHSVILLILGPKWHHLEEKSALSHTNTIKLAIGLRPLLFECQHHKLSSTLRSVYLLWGLSIELKSMRIWKTSNSFCTLSQKVRTMTSLSWCVFLLVHPESVVNIFKLLCSQQQRDVVLMAGSNISRQKQRFHCSTQSTHLQRLDKKQQ